MIDISFKIYLQKNDVDILYAYYINLVEAIIRNH